MTRLTFYLFIPPSASQKRDVLRYFRRPIPSHHPLFFLMKNPSHARSLDEFQRFFHSTENEKKNMNSRRITLAFLTIIDNLHSPWRPIYLQPAEILHQNIG